MHLKRIRVPAVLLGASAIAAITTVWAQSGGAYDASFNTFDAAGQIMSGGSYVLQTGAGQPIAGTSSGSGYSLDVGVLAGGSGAAAAPGSSPTASPSPGATVGPFKRFGPSLAKDGLY
ncbi:MAG: hypothetical protein C0506_01325 [Anaerolinea sp.]|nr:hypothetical protein [Anaerolinea sp.]